MSEGAAAGLTSVPLEIPKLLGFFEDSVHLRSDRQVCLGVQDEAGQKLTRVLPGERPGGSKHPVV